MPDRLYPTVYEELTGQPWPHGDAAETEDEPAGEPAAAAAWTPESAKTDDTSEDAE